MNRYRNRVLTGLAVTLATIAALGTSAPARAATTPFITDNGTSAIIATEGPNHTLNSYWQTNNTNPWHEEPIAGIGTTFSAPSLTDTGARATVAAEGPGNRLSYYWLTNGTTSWHHEAVAGTGTTFSAPGVAFTDVGNSIFLHKIANLVTAAGPLNRLLFYWQLGTPAWHREQVAPAGSVG